MSDLEFSLPDADPGAYDTLVLGIGNVLWADEGFGIRAAELLNARYCLPPEVRVMDGGTQGIFLLPWVRSAKRLLMFDAVDFGLEPGTLQLVRDEDVPCFMGAKKVSMHQAGFQEVLSSAARTPSGRVWMRPSSLPAKCCAAGASRSRHEKRHLRAPSS